MKRVAEQPCRNPASLSPANCGGLIEAMASLATTPAARSLSPANCGGLIEAPPDFGHDRGAGDLSPANCGGLIEAPWSPSRWRSRVAPFPRELRGPH